MKSKGPLANLSEQQLLRRFNELVHQDQQRTAHLLAAIAEIDQRKLWAKHGCPSMFAFCVERFHMSESVTAKRIWAARTARRFPLVLHMVARGELHLSAVVQLAKHLTDDNHRVVLGRAKHKTSREIDLLVAELAPRPDAPSRIRALPRRAGPVVRSQSEATPASLRAPGSAEHEQPSAAGAVAGPAAPKLPRPHKQIVALALRRYKIEITVDQETHDKLRMLEDLLAHQSPAADPATIVSRAIERLLAETLKKKAAVTYQARPGGRHRAKAGTQRTRAIPAEIRRAVWQRDGGRCAFVDDRGHRCRASRLIEFHHTRPYGRGGEHELGNIALRCRAHNQYQADLDFGESFMRAKRRTDVDRRHSS